MIIQFKKFTGSRTVHSNLTIFYSNILHKIGERYSIAKYRDNDWRNRGHLKIPHFHLIIQYYHLIFRNRVILKNEKICVYFRAYRVWMGVDEGSYLCSGMKKKSTSHFRRSAHAFSARTSEKRQMRVWLGGHS